MPKISLVGAGSVVFAKNLICDILQYPELSDSVICLMDIDAGRLATVEKLARRVVAQLGVKAKIEATLDLRTACRGAKFVITTIQVGGYKPSTVRDFEIPAKYGLKQTIADTLGVGGVFRALRSIPAIAEVARTIQEVGAPDPILLNYTNPMAMIMWGVERLTGIHSVGLCHSVQGTSQQLAAYCGLNVEDISYRVAGINHMAFFLDFEYKGKDAYPYLFRALENPSVFACDRVRFEMMRRLGYFVTESSEHHSEYVPYFIHHGQEVIDQYQIPINEYIRRCESMISSWDSTERDLLNESKPLTISRSAEYGSTIINSVVSGLPSVIYGNVPNTGIITNLPQGCCVEVPCLVDKRGIQPTHIGALPPQLASIIRTNVNVQELAVEAAITQQREYIYHAVMADPHTATVLTLDKIWAMCDELIEAHQKDGFLGEFKPVVRNTGKPLSAVSRVFLSTQPVGVPFLGRSRIGQFELIAENETSTQFDGEVELEITGVTAKVSPNTKLNVSVPAHGVAKIPFTVECLEEIAGTVGVDIKPFSAETVERGFEIRQRNEIRIPASELGDKRVPLEVKWSGNVVASGEMGLTAKELQLELRVNDTDVKITPLAIWDGSAVEICIKNSDPTNLLPTVVVALPDAEAPQLLCEGSPYTGGTVQVCRDAAGYTLQVALNLNSAGLSAGKPFLCELVFHVSALGTAHGKIRAAWQGTSRPKFDQSRFALCIPAP